MRQFQIFGRLGKDVELKHVGEKNTAKARFSVAVTDERDKEKAHWFQVAIWGKQAEVAARFLQKGDRVSLWGRIDLEQWQDRQGNSRQAHVFNAEGVDLVEPPRREQQVPKQDVPPSSPQGQFDPDDDIPF